MGTRKTIELSRFDGGIAGDNREPSGSKCKMVRHFDIFTSPYRLIPYRSTEADTSTNVSATDGKQYDINDFQLGTDGKVYALGKVVATGYPKVVKKTVPTTGNWLSSAGNNIATAEGEGNGARILGCFNEWQGFFWFFQGTNQLAKCTLAGAITNSVITVGTTIASVAQGVIGGDGNLYLFYNNNVVRVSAAGVGTDDVCSGLPSNMMITSCCAYGSYMAIGMATKTSTNTVDTSRPSKVFLWDNTSTGTADVIDWGEGALMVLGNIEGGLVGVSDKNLSTSASVSLAVGNGSMVIKRWTGGSPRVMKEIFGTENVTLGRFLRYKVIKDNKLYWVASVPFEGLVS